MTGNLAPGFEDIGGSNPKGHHVEYRCSQESPPASKAGRADRGEENMEKIKIEQHSFAGTLWVGAWLFTIGFLQFGFWKAVLAIVLWPYYLGLRFSLAAH